jgi:hypothetical protein
VPGVREDEILAALAVRPASWLHPFLRLAANQASAVLRTRPGTASHWFRLGPPDADGRCRFIWHPPGHPQLFTGYVGTIGATATDNGCRLEVAGRADGGDEPANRLVLQTLTQLLASALAAGHDDG